MRLHILQICRVVSFGIAAICLSMVILGAFNIVGLTIYNAIVNLGNIIFFMLVVRPSLDRSIAKLKARSNLFLYQHEHSDLILEQLKGAFCEECGQPLQVSSPHYLNYYVDGSGPRQVSYAVGCINSFLERNGEVTRWVTIELPPTVEKNKRDDFLVVDDKNDSPVRVYGEYFLDSQVK